MAEVPTCTDLPDALLPAQGVGQDKAGKFIRPVHPSPLGEGGCGCLQWRKILQAVFFFF